MKRNSSNKMLYGIRLNSHQSMILCHLFSDIVTFKYFIKDGHVIWNIYSKTSNEMRSPTESCHASERPPLISKTYFAGASEGSDVSSNGLAFF